MSLPTIRRSEVVERICGASNVSNKSANDRECLNYPMTSNQSRFADEGMNGPQTLGVWLLALQSFVEGGINSPYKTNEGFVLKRDYTDEARIVHEVLLRCSQIVISLNLSGSRNTLGEAEARDATASTIEDSSDVAEQRSTGALWETLKDATNLVEAMLKTSAVSLQGWTSFNNVLMRELHNSEAATQAMSAVKAVGTSSLHKELLALTEKIAPESLAADLSVVFATLARQLDYLSFIEAHLRGGQTLKPLLPVFTLVNRETYALLEHIEKRILKDGHAEKRVLEALDGTAYALRMELRKAFEHELAGAGDERQPHYLYAKIENAHGLLRNCYQQSIVSLAQMFEPELEGEQLFGAFQTKLDQSLSLRHDIWKLLRAVRHAVEERLGTKPVHLMEILNAFREHGLRLLMYKDWESFERFYEEIEAADGEPQTAHVLHRFEAYLETLFSQVNMRAVLSDHPFEASEHA